MTNITTNLPDQTIPNKLDTSANDLTNTTTAALDNPTAENPPIIDEKSFLQETNTQMQQPAEIKNTSAIETKELEETMVSQPISNKSMVNTTVETIIKPSKIKLTGRMLSFTRLHITGNDLEQIRTQLQQKFASQPNSKMPVVVSYEETLNLAALWAMLWEFGLQPIGIVTGQMDDQAIEQKIAIFPTDGKRIDVLVDDKKADTPKVITTTAHADDKTVTANKDTSAKHTSEKIAATPTATKSEQTSEIADSYTSSLPQTSHLEGDLIYTTMLRSGQSINHVGGDLILTQGINAGAEAITDYSLHVYGKAEGRLVAGATGDENARIFCLRFNPSLVSVAGTFCLRENIPSEFLDKAVQVSFERDKGLIFTLMNG